MARVPSGVPEEHRPSAGLAGDQADSLSHADPSLLSLEDELDNRCPLGALLAGRRAAILER